MNPERLATAKVPGLHGTAASGRRSWTGRAVGSSSSTPRVTSAAIQDGLSRVAPGGTFLQFGVASYDTRVTIEPYRIYNKEITITGSMAVLHSFERAAELFAAGVLDPDVFISDRLPLNDYPAALEMVRKGEGRKIQVLP